MTDVWDEARLQRYIEDETEENLRLDYKRGNVLSKKRKKNDPNWLDELTKDVSAMANSDGGIIIFGIAEKGNIPTGFSAVDRSDFSRETLDQILSSNIRPRIDGLLIHPVPLSSGENDVAYVLEIPQSTTAHQASDKRYHKRQNTTTSWMEDYEIRDVMSRNRNAELNISYLLKRGEQRFAEDIDGTPRIVELVYLNLEIKNVSKRIANYYFIEVRIPATLFRTKPSKSKERILYDGLPYFTWQFSNMFNDTVIPLLPGLGKAETIELDDYVIGNSLSLQSYCYVDEAEPYINNIKFTDIEILSWVESDG
ncbi:MAG: ATP-binding protein [Chloroflexota bacterium]